MCVVNSQCVSFLLTSYAFCASFSLIPGLSLGSGSSFQDQAREEEEEGGGQKREKEIPPSGVKSLTQKKYSEREKFPVAKGGGMPV